MPAPLTFFSIEADDVQAATTFYEAVFGWRYEPWGPPDFYLVETGGSISARHTLVPGRPLNTPRPSYEVEDLDATLAVVAAHGGVVRMPPAAIGNGGWCAYFEDSEGNLIGISKNEAPPTTRWNIEKPAEHGVLRHVAVNADDIPRALDFYEAVLGWRFKPWGPPGFYLSFDSGLSTALQERRELIPGVRTGGHEIGFAVDDVDQTLAAVEAGGGRVLMRPFLIETVGEVAYFADPSGTIIGIARYL